MQKTAVGSWTCLACSYSTSHKTNMYQHVEAKHVQTEGYNCPYCSRFCPNFKSLKNHKTRCPKNEKNLTQTSFGFQFSSLFKICIVDPRVSALMTKSGQSWMCTDCGYSSQHCNVYHHIEAKHISSAGYNCEFCSQFCPSLGAYKKHKYRKHQNQ